MNLSKMFLGAAFALCVAVGASAQTRGIGVGGYIQAGNGNENGGLNGKIFLSANQAIDLSLSIQMNPFGQSMGAYASYLYHYWNVIPVNAGKLPLYWGPNAGVGIWDGGSAIRGGVVGGIEYCMPQGTAPMDFYLQLNPNLELHDQTGQKTGLFKDLYLQLGLRWYFGG